MKNPPEPPRATAIPPAPAATASAPEPSPTAIHSVAGAALDRLESLLTAVHSAPPAPHAWPALHLLLLEHTATARAALALLGAPEPDPEPRSPPHVPGSGAESAELFDLVAVLDTTAHLAAEVARARSIAVHVDTPAHAVAMHVRGPRDTATWGLLDALLRCVAAVGAGGRVDMSCSCMPGRPHAHPRLHLDCCPTVRFVASPVDPAQLGPDCLVLPRCTTFLQTHPIPDCVATRAAHTHMLQLDVVLDVVPTAAARDPACALVSPPPSPWAAELDRFAQRLEGFPVGVVARSDDVDLRRQLAILGPDLVPLDDLHRFPRLVVVALPPAALGLLLAAVDQLPHHQPVGILAITTSPAETREVLALLHGRDRVTSPEPAVVAVHLAERPLGSRSLLGHLHHLVTILHSAPAATPDSLSVSSSRVDYSATPARPGIPQSGGGRPSSPRPPPLAFVPGQLPLAFPYSLELEWPRFICWIEAKATDGSLLDVDFSDGQTPLFTATSHNNPPFRAFVADLAAAAQAYVSASDPLVEVEPAAELLLPDPAMVVLDVPTTAEPVTSASLGSARCPRSLSADTLLFVNAPQRPPMRPRAGSDKAAAVAAACLAAQAGCRPLPKWQPIMKNLCVLVIDDDASSSSSLTAFLTECGVAWDLAANAEDAYAMVTQQAAAATTSSSRPADSPPYHLIFVSLDLGFGSRAHARTRTAPSPLDLIRWIRADEYRRRTSTLARSRSSAIGAAAAAGAAEVSAAVFTDVWLRDRGRAGVGNPRAGDAHADAGMFHALTASQLAHHGTPALIVGMAADVPAPVPASAAGGDGELPAPGSAGDEPVPPYQAALTAGCNAVAPRPVPRAWAETKLAETCAILTLLDLAHVAPAAAAESGGASAAASMRFSDTVATAAQPIAVPMPPTLVGRDGVPEAHGAAAIVVAGMEDGKVGYNGHHRGEVRDSSSGKAPVRERLDRSRPARAPRSRSLSPTALVARVV
ncbi:hypothetical protein H9P43_002750 [Blastocladiella emersonii ATCC 22665]|nr:hypothetical protein H9P43_002750 [Blastocladiella emersonii ATCC 22665]